MTSDLPGEISYQSSDDPDPLPSPPETRGIGGRRLVAGLIRRAGTLLDPDSERYNNNDDLQKRYRRPSGFLKDPLKDPLEDLLEDPLEYPLEYPLKYPRAEVYERPTRPDSPWPD